MFLSSCGGLKGGLVGPVTRLAPHFTPLHVSKAHFAKEGIQLRTVKAQLRSKRKSQLPRRTDIYRPAHPFSRFGNTVVNPMQHRKKIRVILYRKQIKKTRLDVIRPRRHRPRPVELSTPTIVKDNYRDSMHNFKRMITKDLRSPKSVNRLQPKAALLLRSRVLTEYQRLVLFDAVRDRWLQEKDVPEGVIAFTKRQARPMTGKEIEEEFGKAYHEARKRYHIRVIKKQNQIIKVSPSVWRYQPISKPRFPNVKYRRLTKNDRYVTHRLTFTKIQPYLYESMMSFYRKQKNLPEMENFFSQLKEDTGQHTASGFTILIKACLEKGNVNKALSYMRQMREEGFSTLVPFSDILRYCLQKDEARAKMLFGMLEREDVPQSIFTYFIMYCLEGGDVEKAISVYEEMKKRNIRFKADILLSLVQRDFGNDVMKPFHEELRRVPYQFLLVARKFAWAHNIGGLKKLAQLAVDVGFTDEFLERLKDQHRLALINKKKRWLYAKNSQKIISKLTIQNDRRRNQRKKRRSAVPRTGSLIVKSWGRKMALSPVDFLTRKGTLRANKKMPPKLRQPLIRRKLQDRQSIRDWFIAAYRKRKFIKRWRNFRRYREFLVKRKLNRRKLREGRKLGPKPTKKTSLDKMSKIVNKKLSRRRARKRMAIKRKRARREAKKNAAKRAGLKKQAEAAKLKKRAATQGGATTQGGAAPAKPAAGQGKPAAGQGKPAAKAAAGKK